jgi:hypothetical protein
MSLLRSADGEIGQARHEPFLAVSFEAYGDFLVVTFVNHFCYQTITETGMKDPVALTKTLKGWL